MKERFFKLFIEGVGEEYVSFDANTPKEEIDDELSNMYEEMISNSIYGGWEEIEEDDMPY